MQLTGMRNNWHLLYSFYYFDFEAFKCMLTQNTKDWHKKFKISVLYLALSRCLLVQALFSSYRWTSFINGGGGGMATQSSWLISDSRKKRSIFSPQRLLDKKPKTSKNAISFSFSHMLILVARSRNCKFDVPSEKQVESQRECHFFKDALSNGARDTVQIKAAGIHLIQWDKQYKQTILRAWSMP